MIKHHINVFCTIQLRWVVTNFLTFVCQFFYNMSKEKNISTRDIGINKSWIFKINIQFIHQNIFHSMEHQNTYCLLSKLDNNPDISYEFHKAAYFPHYIKFCQSFCKDFFLCQPASILFLLSQHHKIKWSWKRLQEVSGSAPCSH